CEECIVVDGVECKIGSPVLEPNTSHSILCTEEDVMIGNSKDYGTPSVVLDLLKVETIQSNGKLEVDDITNYEKAAGQVLKKEEEGI
ncbi:hypothetical protein KI387_006882, partial [Taxus chinensis]